jgi:hypothetical protein
MECACLADAIWASVCGLGSGLLPSGDDQLVFLEAVISEGKKHWLELGLSTDKPKWHLTFDGHLHDYVKQFGGHSDKLDQAIEKGHQEWKRLQQRLCRNRKFTDDKTVSRELGGSNDITPFFLQLRSLNPRG